MTRCSDGDEDFCVSKKKKESAPLKAVLRESTKSLSCYLLLSVSLKFRRAKLEGTEKRLKIRISENLESLCLTPKGEA